VNQTLASAHKKNEDEKRRHYNERILEVEMGTFTPLVFTTAGGMAKECDKFYSRLAELIADKRKDHKSLVTSWIRCKLSFSLLRSAILCIRGSRSLRPRYHLEEALPDLDVAAAMAQLRI
jgi:hypothetical protein